MIAILCKSACLASEIGSMAGAEKIASYVSMATEGMPDGQPGPWLETCLKVDDVSVVFFETRYFVDPSPYRAISPRTRFVVLSAPGEEADAQKAIERGASAILEKPINQKDVRGVLTLVTA